MFTSEFGSDFSGRKHQQVSDIQDALGSRTCTCAIDCISEGNSTLVLARVLAAKNGPETKSSISRLLPPPEGLKDLLPPGVEVVETFIGSAFGKDAECGYLLTWSWYLAHSNELTITEIYLRPLSI